MLEVSLGSFEPTFVFSEHGESPVADLMDDLGNGRCADFWVANHTGRARGFFASYFELRFDQGEQMPPFACDFPNCRQKLVEGNEGSVHHDQVDPALDMLGGEMTRIGFLHDNHALVLA